MPATEFASLIDACDRAARTVILHDSDADGVTAGVVLLLAKLGFELA